MPVGNFMPMFIIGAAMGRLIGEGYSEINENVIYGGYAGTPPPKKKICITTFMNKVEYNFFNCLSPIFFLFLLFLFPPPPFHLY